MEHSSGKIILGQKKKKKALNKCKKTEITSSIFSKQNTMRTRNQSTTRKKCNKCKHMKAKQYANKQAMNH